MRQKITKLEDLQQLVNLSGLQEIKLNNYQKVITEYEINEGELLCQCSEGKLNVCNQKHKHGYVIQLQNNAYSIIGNTCVKKLGTNTEIRRDINIHNNKRRRFEKIESIKEYFNNKEFYFQKLETIENDKNHLQSQQQSFINSMGNEFNRLIQSSATIKITGIQTRTEKSTNNSSKVKKETIRTPFTIGSIKGFSCVFPERYYSLEQQITSFKKGMNNLIALLSKMELDSYDPSESEINSYRRQLDNFSELERSIQEIKKEWTDFNSNDPKQMVFAYDKPYNFVKYLLNVSKLEAKEFCFKMEHDFKQSHGLDSISKTELNLIHNNLYI